ncbi:MAG: haloacid dehalogenase-like hydrolase [Bacteroidetes bacterium]|nr:haloacid dehalogenase-like hydrolase [Bacteroidota bacterium]
MNGNVIVYDLDGTISKGDTMVAFTQFTHGKIRSTLIYALVSPLILLAYSSLISRHYVKEMVLKLHYRGFHKEDLLVLGKRFSEDFLPSLFYESIYSGIKSQIRDRNIIVILTASCDVWVEPWCRKNQIEFLGSRMEFVDGICTGKLSVKIAEVRKNIKF